LGGFWCFGGGKGLKGLGVGWVRPKIVTISVEYLC
jgi:hypothetical protein